MSPSFWSDDEKVFVPRLGGWSINFKFIAKRLGWVKSVAPLEPAQEADPATETPETSEDRLRRSVERSRFEDR